MGGKRKGSIQTNQQKKAKVEAEKWNTNEENFKAIASREPRGPSF